MSVLMCTHFLILPCTSSSETALDEAQGAIKAEYSNELKLPECNLPCSSFSEANKTQGCVTRSPYNEGPCPSTSVNWGSHVTWEPVSSYVLKSEANEAGTDAVMAPKITGSVSQRRNKSPSNTAAMSDDATFVLTDLQVSCRGSCKVTCDI